ncbi:MAG: choline kinase [Aestuariibacter sp.]
MEQFTLGDNALNLSRARVLEQLQHLFQTVDVEFVGSIQTLWKGYGEIARYWLPEQQRPIVVKHVIPPNVASDDKQKLVSHQRKIRSFAVEVYFYHHLAERCTVGCRTAHPYAVSESDLAKNHETLIVLEDLDASGFCLRGDADNLLQVRLALNWLAHFHAQFLQEQHQSLWNTGSYWHIETRRVELDAMQGCELKKAAAEVALTLAQSNIQTVIHGDAKLANFCFHQELQSAAAVDFQYTGGGAGIIDVMLLFSSALSNDSLFSHADTLLEHYFSALQAALRFVGKVEQIDAVETCWRKLYSFAWADYQRFLMGWKPGHPRINEYMQAQTSWALKHL